MNAINRFREIYWSRKGEKVPQIVKKKFATTHPKKFMFTAGICARGKTAMYIVPEKNQGEVMVLHQVCAHALG